MLVINGPNLNLLGAREPDVYGAATYDDLVELIATSAAGLGVAVDCFQSNHEGALIDAIHETAGEFDGIVINPGAYTHYSYAIHDALKSVPVPAVEVHISNVHTREDFRHKSVTAHACRGQIVGLGFFGYVAAMEYLLNEVQK
ncbi:MAG: type II 3-dehydroquinate dehydratase [Oscillospiraceae bacterium]|nr:type II 3-dehydroquinate dehydratase [Oscillospiraceae bacterium]